MAKLLTLLFFTLFLLKLVFFFKNLILPAERRRFLKNKKKTTKKTKTKMAKLLTYDGQVIDPTADLSGSEMHTFTVRRSVGSQWLRVHSESLKFYPSIFVWSFFGHFCHFWSLCKDVLVSGSFLKDSMGFS